MGHRPPQTRQAAPVLKRGGDRSRSALQTADSSGGDAAASNGNSAFSGQSASELSQRAADGLLINGTANNGASSPFAQAQAFGNNRRGTRSQYNGNIGILFDNSFFDAQNFSITGQATPKPSYDRLTGVFAFGGPFKIPRWLPDGGQFFINYQWTRNRNATVGARAPGRLRTRTRPAHRP